MTEHNRKPLMIKVLVFDIASGDQIRERTVNFADKAIRKWLILLTVWAMTTGKAVELVNVMDDVS